MADNAPLPLATGSTRNAATDQVTYSGDVADVQLIRIVDVTGAEGSKTVISPTFNVLQPDVTASGTMLLLNDAIPITLSGDGAWAIDLSGFAGHVVTFEAQVNSGTPWRAINGALQGVGSLSSTASADGTYRGAAAALAGIRARLSTLGTGTVTASLRASVSSAGVFQMAPTPAGTNLIGYIEGTAGALLARDGTDISAPTAMPAGGVGIRGWLSSIWTKLNGSIAVTGTFWQATQPVSGTFFQATQPVSLATNTPTLAAGTAIAGKFGIDQTTPHVTNQVTIQASTLAVTVTAAANTAATLTLPAPGAGLFHYITGLEIMRTATAALAGTATLVVTTTNLPGSLAWSFGNAMAAGGTQKDLILAFDNPLKSLVANTASTIVMPAAGAAVLWRANVY